MKMTIVARLAQLEGDWLGAPKAQEWTGAPLSVCRRSLAALEADRIILRDHGDDRAAKVMWCGVNPDWRAWRVEWALPIGQVAGQLALAREERDQPVWMRVIARSYSARSRGVIARSYGARSDDEEAPETAVIARHRTARSPRAADRDRAVEGPPARTGRALLERAITTTDPKEVSHLGFSRAEDNSSSLDRPRASEERVLELGVGQLKAKIVAAAIPAPGTHGKFLRGKPLAQLLDLVQEHGLDAVDKAFGRIEPGALSPVRIVEALADLMMLAPCDREALAPPEIDAEAIVKHLTRQVATWREDGGEPPDNLVADLAKWQDVLREKGPADRGVVDPRQAVGAP